MILKEIIQVVDTISDESNRIKTIDESNDILVRAVMEIRSVSLQSLENARTFKVVISG